MSYRGMTSTLGRRWRWLAIVAAYLKWLELMRDAAGV